MEVPQVVAEEHDGCQGLMITALFRDEDKLRTYRGTQATRPSIDIYSLAGKSIRSINVGCSLSYCLISKYSICPNHSDFSGTKVQSRV